MISRCTLSGEECFSLLQGQTVVSVFNLQKVHIAFGFACNENAVHPLLLAAARLNGIVQKIAQHRTQFHIGKRHLIGKIEPHLKFCPLCLRHAVVVFNQRIYNGILQNWAGECPDVAATCSSTCNRKEQISVCPRSEAMRSMVRRWCLMS